MVDSACALTGSGKGVITTVDERGQRVDFLTSGLSAEEVRALVAWPEGPRLLEHLRDIEQPFQVADLPGYFESSGLPPGPWAQAHDAGRSDAPSGRACRPRLRR